jgi:hypothetical protein
MYVITAKDKKKMCFVSSFYGAPKIKWYFSFLWKNKHRMAHYDCAKNEICMRAFYKSEQIMWTCFFHELAHAFATTIGDYQLYHLMGTQYLSKNKIRKLNMFFNSSKKAGWLLWSCYCLEAELYVDSVGREIQAFWMPSVPPSDDVGYEWKRSHARLFFDKYAKGLTRSEVDYTMSYYRRNRTLMPLDVSKDFNF